MCAVFFYCGLAWHHFLLLVCRAAGKPPGLVAVPTHYYKVGAQGRRQAVAWGWRQS